MKYIAGQAPREFSACERLLFKSIESRQGLFQIVSTRSHAALEETAPKEEDGKFIKSVIEQLREQIFERTREEGHSTKPPLRIGGRFEVVSLAVCSTEALSSTYVLKVKDTDPLANNEIIAIPLTQAGLKFDDQVLQVPEIIVARGALASHLAFVSQLNPAVDVEPVIISGAGVGRNATLIMYRQIGALIEDAEITTEEELDSALLREISVGRAARGLHFVHSEGQLEQLRSALMALLPPQPDSFRSTELTFNARGIPEKA